MRLQESKSVYKNFFNFKLFFPIGFIFLGLSFIAFFMNCSGYDMGPTTISQDFIMDEESSFIGSSTSEGTEAINRNCRYDLKNGCFSGTLKDIPDVNRTFKWECRGSYGTAYCAKANPNRVCSIENYCLDGKHADLPETNNHEWFECTEGDGTVTHCSIPKEGVIDGACHHETINGCLNGTLNDTPNINRVVKWQCQGVNGGITAECEEPAQAFVCSLEGYCLDGTKKDLPSTATHDWFECAEGDGTVTHCSISKDRLVNGSCGGDAEGPYCMDGTYTLVEETDAYWKYTCTGTGGGTTANCFQCKNTPHFGAKDETCLPSCGHAKTLYCKKNDCDGFVIARGDSCSSANKTDYVIHQLETYEENACCLRKQKSRSDTTTTTTIQEQVNGACGGDAEGPYCMDGTYTLVEETDAHWKYTCTGTGGTTINCLQCKSHYKDVDQSCTPSCGHAFSIYCKTHDCKGLDHKNGKANCQNPSGWDIIQELTAYDGPCCVRKKK